MEPTSKALQTLAGAVRENAKGVGRSPLDVLQVINLKADLQSREGGFKDLLRAETGRADVQRASRPGTPEPASRPPERPEPQAGRSEDGGRKASEGSETAETGKSSPAADRNLPPASEGSEAQQAHHADSGEETTPVAENGDVPEQAASPEAPETQVAGPAESGVAAEVEPEVAAVTDESLLETGTTAEGAAGNSQAAATEEQPVAAHSDVQDVSDAAGGVPATAETEIPAGPEILPDAEDVAVAAGPAVTGNGPGKTGPTGREQAAERVAANLERNPDAAGDGLRRAQEAIAQAAAKPAPAHQPAGAEATGRSATAGGIEIAGRATDAPTLRDTPTVDAQPAAPRPAATPTAQLPFTGELNPQVRMPAVAAAQQAEQALAARAMAGEVIEAKISAAANTTATTAAATAAQPATTTPAQATEAARAALQQVRASFTRPGWDQAMAQRVAQLAARGVQSAQIEVDPPELGPVKVVIQVNNDNQTSVSFSSPHAGVREVLEQTAQRLRDALAEGGMDLVDVEVSDQSAERRESAEDAQDREPGTGTRAWRGGEIDADADAPVTVTVRDSDALVDHYV